MRDVYGLLLFLIVLGRCCRQLCVPADMRKQANARALLKTAYRPSATNSADVCYISYHL